MFKSAVEFDEFFQYFSVADVDVKYMDNDGDEWMQCVAATYAEVGSPVSADVIAIAPASMLARGAVERPTKGRGRGRSCPSLTASTRSSGRFKARKQASAPRRRHRDRRRNDVQRQRENEKRKQKQCEFTQNRDACLEAEFVLRGRVVNILMDLSASQGVSVHHVLHMLPPDLLKIMQASNAALPRYREFTGQKHICAMLNSFPMWPEIDGVKLEPTSQT